MSLFSRQDDFALEWSDEITAAVLASRKAAAEEALASAVRAGEVGVAIAPFADLIARFGKQATA
ncbi:hypothetical protein [Streptomyces sp. NPDC056628]|uniref:hypothetical protein n=1 Tax=Streptomyces sp. NPDC056628 TaxID=3345882 RepID=UPI0036B7D9B8